MVWEFILWLAAASVLQVLLQQIGRLPPLMSLLIAAPVAAVVITLGLIAVNGRFRRCARQVEARVDQCLPPLRSGGLPRVQVSYTLDGQRFTHTLTLEQAAVGTNVPLWALGRHVRPALPSVRSDFRVLALCAAIMALATLGYLCTRLLPDPTAKTP
jgi:hypothetical protein